MNKNLIRVVSLAALLTASASTQAAMINEIEPNPTGSDPSNQMLELLGSPLTSFSGFVLSIESDPSSPGIVDRSAEISGAFDANGLLTVSIPDLENPSFTLLLTDSFTGSVGTTDIDTSDDGIVDDTSSLGTRLDAIGVPDSTGDEAFLYGAQLNGDDFAFTGGEPGLIFRDRLDLAWYAINDPAGSEALDIDASPVAFTAFDTDPSVATFGAVNPTAVPVPAAVWLLGSALGLLGLRLRRSLQTSVSGRDAAAALIAAG